jgi:spore maturation protein CgeB
VKPLSIVILGLSIRSSWGNGHATTYRGLVRALAARGHRVLFLERNVPWYAQAVDTPRPAGARLKLYDSLEELKARYTQAVRTADLTIVGSYTPQGAQIGDWVLRTTRGVSAFYDIDTPVTVEGLASRTIDYLSRGLMRRYDLYLSFTGGPLLARLAKMGAAMPRPLHCSADLACYFSERHLPKWDLGYMGTYSQDRAAAMEELLLYPARLLPGCRMVVAGPQYPGGMQWPINIERYDHLAPGEHRAFFYGQRFTLNLTREPMKRVGYSPSIRLFEAAASGCAMISDWWPGLDDFFEPGREILVVRNRDDVLRFLTEISDHERITIAAAARKRVLAEHTSEQRARQLEGYLEELGCCREIEPPAASR